jgi:carbonic anhydrase
MATALEKLPNDVDQRLLPARLVTGYEVFLGGRFRREQDRYGELAKRGQSPKVLLIGCCDSRVSPEVIFDADPGEIFVIRNIANLVPPFQPTDDLHDTSAGIEFAVNVLKVEHIVIMGHASCGGVRAFVDQAVSHAPPPPGDFIANWITLIKRAADQLGPPTEPLADYAERLAKAAILNTLQNLRTFPYVRELEAAGKLALHGAYFGVADGRLFALHEAKREFVPIAEEAHAQAVAAPRF